MKNTKPVSRRWLAAPAVVAGALALGACANNVPRPTSTVSQAELAINEAAQTQAPQYAPLPLQKAREKLQQAQQSMAEENYLQARRLAEQALVDAQLAQSVASARQAQNAAQELEQSLQTLRQEAIRGGTPTKTGVQEKQQ